MVILFMYDGNRTKAPLPPGQKPTDKSHPDKSPLRQKPPGKKKIP